MANINLMKAITEGTFIPISLVIVMFGGVVWLTNLNSQTVANAQTLLKIEQKQDAYNQNMEMIIRKLSRIEGKLKIDER